VSPETASSRSAAPYREVSFFGPEVVLSHTADGALLLRSAEPLGPYDATMGEWLERWATRTPRRTFLVEQRESGEVSIDYGETRRRVLRIAEGLLKHELSAERPLVILSTNGIDHALLMLAALHIGVPLSPIAPAYALQSGDLSKLIRSLELLTPGLIVVEDGEAYRAAAETIASRMPVPMLAFRNPQRAIGSWQTLEGDGSRQQDVRRAFDSVRPETVAKFLFTSGSSGVPKAVINTHAMLCAAAKMQQRIAPFFLEEPPTMVDWLPWNHTAGGNSDFNIVLSNGGTMYIDPGKPTPELIGKSVALLKRVSPTIYFNVPMGFEALLPYLRSDAQLNATFFRKMRYLWYAAAAMQPSTWEALESLATAATGERVLILTGLGMTETSPLALFGNKVANGPGVVGIPGPGLELKLVRHGDQFEARYRGPNVTPGYWRDAAATRAAFDEDGFFLSGDLLAWADESRPEAGLTFEGRISEDFKVSSGTKVAAGALRLSALFLLGPLAKDVVIAGEGRNDVRMLIFPDWAACAQAAGLDPARSAAELAAHDSVKALFRGPLAEIAAKGSGNSNRIVAAMLVPEAPSAAGGELTEKGTINGRRLLRNRPELLEALYAEAGEERVMRG
jgi:feruloyl-CoA synthase